MPKGNPKFGIIWRTGSHNRCEHTNIRPRMRGARASNLAADEPRIIEPEKVRTNIPKRAAKIPHFHLEHRPVRVCFLEMPRLNFRLDALLRDFYNFKLLGLGLSRKRSKDGR